MTLSCGAVTMHVLCTKGYLEIDSKWGTTGHHGGRQCLVINIGFGGFPPVRTPNYRSPLRRHKQPLLVCLYSHTPAVRVHHFWRSVWYVGSNNVQIWGAEENKCFLSSLRYFSTHEAVALEHRLTSRELDHGNSSARLPPQCSIKPRAIPARAI